MLEDKGAELDDVFDNVLDDHDHDHQVHRNAKQSSLLPGHQACQVHINTDHNNHNNDKTTILIMLKITTILMMIIFDKR